MKIRRVAVELLWILAVLGPIPTTAYGRQPPPIVREADFSDKPYLSLEDVAHVMGGEVQEYPVYQRVDLSFRSHQIQFSLVTATAAVDGQSEVLDQLPVKDHRGVWVPRSFFQSGPLEAEFRKRISLGPAEAPAANPATIHLRKGGDVAGGRKGAAPTPAVPAAPAPASVPEEPEPKEVPHTIRRIVIDPGHGGKDPGAIGGRGTEEKTVNLWMGQELADALREKDFEVILTRTDDTFIPLSGRSALANRYKADLFISLHCNASLSSKMRGLETFILSEKASAPHAAAVARLENASLEFEGKSPSAPVQAVLRSLTKNANINRSAQLAGILDRNVAQQVAHSDLGVQQAAFYVLRGAEMPAVLIELGFLSNPAEEKLLEDRGYREKLIRAIEASILEFDRKQQNRMR